MNFKGAQQKNLNFCKFCLVIRTQPLSVLKYGSEVKGSSLYKCSFVQKPKRFLILSSDKSSERNLSSFFDKRKPRRIDPYFRNISTLNDKIDQNTNFAKFPRGLFCVLYSYKQFSLLNSFRPQVVSALKQFPQYLLLQKLVVCKKIYIFQQNTQFLRKYGNCKFFH